MSKQTKQTTGTSADTGEWGQRLALAAGILIGLCFLKFGVPVVLPQAHQVPPDWLAEQWPMPIAYLFLLGVLVYGLVGAKIPRDLPRWLLWAPAVWLGWQVLAKLGSRFPNQTTTVLLHLTAVTACYYLGLFCLSRLTEARKFWLPVAIALLLVLFKGFSQQHGELATTAQFIEENEATGWTNLPPDQVQQLSRDGSLMVTPDGRYTVVPEVLKRVRGGRVAGTLTSPNSLAGIILLTLPAILVTVWRSSEKLPKIGRMVAYGLMLYLGIACLIWSGSKAGWLVAMAMILAWVLAQQFPTQWKWAILAVVLIGGAGGFWFKYGERLKNPTSVIARFDYWKAALKLTLERPLLGHGPGTFGSGYTRIKSPESEPTKLTHNDYLEQACDSGLPGFILFIVWIAGSMRRVWSKGLQPGADALVQAMSLGLIGWALQSFVEFGLYVPAIGWTAMLMLGWLTGLAQTASTGSQSSTTLAQS